MYGMLLFTLVSVVTLQLETLSKDWRRLGGGQPEVKFPALELISIITSSVARVHSQWRRRET